MSFFAAGSWENDIIFGGFLKQIVDPSCFVRALKPSNVTDQNALYYTMPYLFYFHPKISSYKRWPLFSLKWLQRSMMLIHSLCLTAFPKCSYFI